MSIKFCCFASGSKGNCTYVTDGKTDLLIDLGISATRAERALTVLGGNPDRAAILVTHEHSDHIGGIAMFAKRHPECSVHCQARTAPALLARGIKPIVDNPVFAVGDISVEAVPVPHDVPCVGYVIHNHTKSVAVVTDIGRAGTEILDCMAHCDLVMIEANHDLEKLAANPCYTSVLKARIRSDRGHLSNPDCAEACAYLAKNGVKNFVLAHLSEENNAPDLALSTVKSAIERIGLTANVYAASKTGSGLFEVC